MATRQLAYDQSSNTYGKSYDVFLSFKSEDTGKNFTNHLSRALNQAGFRTFEGGDDNNESRREEEIKSELFKAIQDSKMCIIVFSQNYASSSWCLDQLVSILEYKMKFACMILPIFHHVDPSNLRKHKGSFGEALNRHEEKFKCERVDEKEYWEDKLKKWKDALSQAADLAGMVLENQHESTFIKKVINVISTRLSRPALYIASCSIGIHRRARPINSWVQDDGSNNSNIGILLVCGIGGIGKTTLAKFVYNLNFGYFEISCFLANIRETSKLPNGLIALQKQLLSILLKNEKVKISSVDEGIIKIRNALCYRKVLLVLDDVDEPDLVEAIFDMKDWFGFGSKIIVTTRHKSLLRPQLGHEVHEVGILYTVEANELFNFHAFGHENNQISKDYYKEYLEEVIEWCRGLPLALQVIGSSLAGKSKDVWRSAIGKLREIPTNKIVEKLRLSYELLEDDHDQNLFLHLCCFFVGMKKDFVVRILDKCDFYTLVGIQNLIDRSLVTIEFVNEITIHQVVRDMGRDIVRREATVDPGKRTRLWHHTDSYNVLTGKTGTERVQGMVLDMRMIKKYKCSRSLIPLKQSPIGFFTAWSSKVGNFSLQDHVRTDAFEKMHKLKFLQFNKVKVNGSYKNFPKGLRWLCWSGFPEECIPNEFPMGNVVSIDMRYSSLKQLWNGYKFLQYLEILDLSHSSELITTPDFSGLTNLEKLILEHCTKLINVHNTVGCLQKLMILNLKDCHKLKILPDSICELKCLETLNISGCSNIVYLPTELDKLTSLKELYADGISMINLEAQTWYSSLWAWAWKGRGPLLCPKIHFPKSLHVLNIAKCNLSPDAFNNVDLGIMTSLRWLDLGGNPIDELPDSIKNLTRLKTLNIAYCTKIKYLEGVPSNVTDVNADGCISLEKVGSCAKGHPVEGYLNCINLVEAEGVFKLEPLDSVDPQVLANKMGISNLETIMKSSMVSLVFGRAYDAERLRNEYPGHVQDDITSLFSLSPKKLPPQILYHRGVFSTFLPGESVPNWFSYKFTDAAEVYCTLPNNFNSHTTINGLSICFVYKCPEPYTNVGLYDGPAIWVRNQTKDLNWALYPAWFGLPQDDQTGIMWLSYWKVNNLFEQGDIIEVMGSPQFAEFKELGVKIFYIANDEQTENYDPFEDILRNDFSDEERTYYICT
ncbi:TMV resistance protein N-like [Solanum pennellii]|uniref:TMV resistance protein N-like n=1 Tax=Solanum pennellii TaxID=28526 RepID=A0ABM1HET0_SOLPN|nr:TMV resistance protein N-like [Solanum pennellii]